MSLIPCSSCSRHVRATEVACPFCGVTCDAPPAPSAVVVPERFSGRAQIMSFRARAGAIAVAAAIGTSGCYTSGPLYGAPPEDAGVDAGAPADGGVDAGVDAASVALYGGPPSP